MSELIQSYTNSNVTVVTAYYPLPNKSKYGINTYIDWIKKFCKLNINVIIFTIAEYADIIRKFRKPYNTYIIIKPFEELTLWNEPYQNIWKSTWLLDSEKDRHSPELYCLWGMKPYFVKDAMELNVFNSRYFVWMDIGFIRDMKLLKLLSDPFCKVEELCDSGRICFMEVYRCSDKIIEDMRDISRGVSYPNLLGGGMISGDIEAWNEFREIYTRTLIDYHNRGFFVGKD
jgi:hypothetical protein